METIPSDVLLYFADRFVSLKDRSSLSRSCSGFLELREALFEKLELDSSDYARRKGGTHILDLVRDNSKVFQFVKDLTVKDTDNPKNMITILSKMTSIRKLHLAVRWCDSPDVSAQLEGALLRLVGLPTIQSVTFSDKGGVPIVKIVNNFHAQVHPIDHLHIHSSSFTLIELQTHVITGMRAPPADPYDKDAREAMDIFQAKYLAAATQLAPRHLGSRWLPTHMEVLDGRDFWTEMNPFFSFANLKSLTVDWPPRELSQFDAWQIPVLDLLRFRVVGSSSGPWVSLGQCDARWRARMFKVVISPGLSEHFETAIKELPGFLSGATGIEQVHLKLIAHNLILNADVLDDIRSTLQSISCNRPNSTSMLFGLSIAYPHPHMSWRRPLKYVWEPFNFSKWFKEVHESLQGSIHGPEHKFKAGLFWEIDHEITWDFTPALDVIPRDIAPAWFSSNE